MAQGTTKGVPIDIDPLLAADSDLLVPSQKAIKTYVDNSNINQVETSRTISTTAPLAGGGDLSANRTLSITQATASTNGYLSSTDWTNFANNIQIAGFKAMGSSIKCQSLSVYSINQLTTSTNLADGGIRFSAIYIPVDSTITGVIWWQALQGVYTADNYNGVGLYAYNSGTGTLTLVASSTNDGNTWKGTTNSWQTKAFSSPYSASAGLYYVAALFNASATTTAPTIGIQPNSVNTGIATFDFTNSAKIQGTLSLQASLPSPQAMSGIGSSNNNFGFWVY